MKIEDQFRVDVPIEEAWRVLLDVERIAPCMPGAQLQEIEGDEYRGVVKVKVGPISAQYKGAARILEADEDARRIVLKGEGRDTRGQGNASATVTVLLEPDGDGTRVAVDTDLNVTGKVAQFGRGVMADVSSKLLGQFVACLEVNVLGGDPTEAEAVTASASDNGDRSESAASASTESEPPVAGAASAVGAGASAGSAPPASSGVRVIDSPEAQPVDLMDAAGGALAKRLVPLLAGVTLLAILIWVFRRKKS
jgi:carbon monoxide dehydrogenase subunit G